MDDYDDDDDYVETANGPMNLNNQRPNNKRARKSGGTTDRNLMSLLRNDDDVSEATATAARNLNAFAQMVTPPSYFQLQDQPDPSTAATAATATTAAAAVGIDGAAAASNSGTNNVNVNVNNNADTGGVQVHHHQQQHPYYVYSYHPRYEFMHHLMVDEFHQHLRLWNDRQFYANSLQQLVHCRRYEFLSALEEAHAKVAHSSDDSAQDQHHHHQQQQQSSPSSSTNGLGGGATTSTTTSVMANNECNESSSSLTLLARQQQAEYVTVLSQQLHQAKYDLRMTLHRQKELHCLASAYAQQQPIVIDTSACTTYANANVPTTTINNKNYTTTTTTTANGDPFHDVLGEHLHAHILSYLLHITTVRRRPDCSATTREENPEVRYGNKKETMATTTVASDIATTTTRPHRRQQLGQLCFFQTLSLVSKRWYRVVGIVVNTKAATALSTTGIVTAKQLHTIKCRAAQLRLRLRLYDDDVATPTSTNSGVNKTFINLLWEKWGNQKFISLSSSSSNNDDDVYDEEGDVEQHRRSHPLDLIIERFADGSETKFAQLVATEYTKFLVVKCVETIAAATGRANQTNTSSGSTCAAVEQQDDLETTTAATSSLQVWTEKCQPNNALVELFWHAHMLSPIQYALDCQALIGDMVGGGRTTTAAAATSTIANYSTVDNAAVASGGGGAAAARNVNVECIIDPVAGHHVRPGDKNAAVVEGSDYASKRDLLFEFEQGQLVDRQPKDYFDGRLGDGYGTAQHILFTENFHLSRVAAEIWKDMLGLYNDCG